MARTFAERFGRGAGYTHSRALGNFIPTAFLAPIIEDLIAEEEKYLRNGGDGEDAVGAVENIASRATLYIEGSTQDAILRRIYSIRQYETESSEARIADAILLACNRHIRDLDLPEFPSGIKQANEMVTVWIEECGGESDDPKLLAYQMARFVVGFNKSDEICDPEIAEKKQKIRDATNARHRIYQERNRALAAA